MTREHLELIKLTIEWMEMYTYDVDFEGTNLDMFSLDRLISTHKEYLELYEVELEECSSEKRIYDRIKVLIGRIEFDLILDLLQEKNIEYIFNGRTKAIQSLEWSLVYENGNEFGYKITSEFGGYDYDDLKKTIESYEVK